jgi:hypothetical protein
MLSPSNKKIQKLSDIIFDYAHPIQLELRVHSRGATCTALPALGYDHLVRMMEEHNNGVYCMHFWENGRRFRFSECILWDGRDLYMTNIGDIDAIHAIQELLITGLAAPTAVSVVLM